MRFRFLSIWSLCTHSPEVSVDLFKSALSTRLTQQLPSQTHLACTCRCGV